MINTTPPESSDSVLARELDYSKQRDVSCRVTSAVIKYLESLGYNTDALLYGLPYTRKYLLDALNWISFEVRETVCQRAADLTHDDKIMYQVAITSPGLNSFGGLEHLVRLLGNPKIAYNNVGKYSALFDRTLKFKTTSVSENQALIDMSLPEGYQRSKNSCYFAQGMLAIAPTLWGLPLADVRETHCMCKTDDYDNIANITEKRSCLYQVTWQPLPPARRRLLDRITRNNPDTSSTIKKLEENFALLDRKNAELASKNLQLAKVRELALAIDGVKSRDQVYQTVAEMARDIPGIRFVIILKVDESGKNITIPHYSKLRNKTLVAALKSIGFDVNAELGENSNSQKFKFPISISEFVRQYSENPKTIVKSSLADLMDGMWPRPLSETIQRISNFKCIALTPVIVDGEPWGAMAFYLSDEVDKPILEMVAAHCSSALKNVAALERQQQRNAELKESEDYQRILVSSLLTGVVTIDAQTHQIVDINSYACKFFGAEKKDIIGHVCHQYICPAEKGKCPISDLKQQIDSSERKILKADKTLSFILKSVTMIKRGSREFLVESFTDIQPLKEAQTALFNSEQQYKSLYEEEKRVSLELIEEAKTRAQFINVLAHELRTPLTPILISVEMLSSILPVDLQRVERRLINNTLSSAQSLQTRLEELLDLARFTRGAFILKPQLVYVSEFLETIVLRYQPVLEQKKQQLVLEISPNLSQFEVDPSRIEQVLLNLLSNASKYSPENTTINFKASIKNYSILVEVKDQGIGIAPAEQLNLFLPYHRVEQDRQRYPGIGLGLAVAKMIVEAHGGKIWVESALDKGCTFKFTLPIKTEFSQADVKCPDPIRVSEEALS
jgi:PAS domain S-box-containing protein